MKSPKLLVALAAAAALPAFADSAAQVQATLDHAHSAHREALTHEHGWAVTEPLIEEARAALEAGHVREARAAAERALLTAEQALQQAREEREAWKDRVVQR